MTNLELLAELIDDLARDLRPEVESLMPTDLAWLPGPQANSIGVTLWHIARGMDFLATQVLQNQPSEAELWHTLGWAARTGYDPRGHGYEGWGVITGYTWAEVLAIPALTAADLLEYLDRASQALSAQVRALTPNTASQRVPHLMGGKLTRYRWVKEFYKGFQAHVGEIVAIQALMKRSAQAATLPQFLYRLRPTRPAMLVDGPTPEEAAIVSEHFAYLERQVAEGTVLLAGRTQAPDPTGFGITIFRTASDEAAHTFMANDPAVSGGVMTAELFPYRVALLARNW